MLPLRGVEKKSQTCMMINLIINPFSMKKNIQIFAAAMVANFLLVPLVMAETLSDISGHKYQSAIQSLVDMNVIDGHPDGTFRPDTAINRAEFLKIVVGASADNIGTGANCFPDVKTDWYAKYVCYAKSIGIVEGYPDGLFRPAQNVNYVEAMKMLYEANNDDGLANPEGSEWYSKYSEDAVQNQIFISGIALNQMMKRGEIAQLTWNYREQKGLNDGGTTDGGTTDGGTTDGGTTDGGTTDGGTSDGGTYTGSGSAGVDQSACAAMTVPAGAIYVATSGNDTTGDGSSSAPYRTVNNAIQNVSAGDTIVVRAGTYVEPDELRIREANVTLMSYPGEWAVLDRTSDSDNAGVYFYVGSNGGKLQCIEVMGGYYAFSTETMWDWGEADISGASNILIENAKLHDSANDVVKIKPNSDNITIRKSEIYNSGKAQTPGDCNAEGIDNVNGDNTVVQDNYIHNTCSTGVYLKGGATNGLIEGNVIENTGAAGILVGFDTSPEYFDTAVNPDYYENIGGIVRNNLIMNTGWAGIGLYASKDAQVYNNTIVNAASVYHSAIYFGVTFQDWEDSAGRPANVNPTIRDNVVSQSSSLDMPMVSIRYSDELGGLSALEGNATMSGNCYFQQGGAARFHDGRDQMDVGGWMDDWEGNLAEWKTHMATDTDSLETDPQLNSDHMAGGTCAGKGYGVL